MDNTKLTPEEYKKLMEQLECVDVHNEFREEWKSDINKVKSFIKLRMRSVLPEYGEKFYEYITRIRDLKGLNNAILARRMGLSDSYLSKYFNGSGISKENALALMIALELETPQIEAIFKLTGFHTYQECFENDIINYHLEHSNFSGNANSVAECNRELLEFGFNSLTTIGTPAFGK